MASNEQIINEAQTFINNELTVSETSELFHISKRTFQLHMKALEVIDSKLYKLVEEKRDRLQVKGRIVGGMKGKRGPTWSKELALSIADAVIESELTYEQAAEQFEIPSSTIYEMLNSSVIDTIRKDKLNIVKEANIRKKTMAQIVEESKELERKSRL